MNVEDLERAVSELSPIVQNFREGVEAKGAEGDVARVGLSLATLATVVAGTAKLVIDCKSQLDEAAYREQQRRKGEFQLRNERAIRFFAEMPKDVRESLVQAVETALPDISVDAFSERVAKDSPLLGSQVRDVLGWVSFWFSYLRGNSSEERVNSLAAYMVGQDAMPGGLHEQSDASNLSSPFMQHLKRLLRCHPSGLGITEKAEDLLSRDDRRFEDATVSTDLRPIFGGNVDDAPAYSLVLHNLVLRLNDGGSTRTIGLTLTSKDILKLADALDRAYKKEKTLRQHAAYQILPVVKQ